MRAIPRKSGASAARQKQVFVALSAVPNATNRELTAITGLRINEVTPRVNELRKRGVVVEACHRPCRQSGRTVIAWRSVALSLPPAFPEKPAEETKNAIHMKILVVSRLFNYEAFEGGEILEAFFK
jgi:hypothetical protein